MHNAFERLFYLQCVNYILPPSGDSPKMFGAVTASKTQNNKCKLEIMMRMSIYLQEKSCVPHTTICNIRYHT